MLFHGASFEPGIDYVVTKIPRFAFEKFPQARAPASNPNGIPSISQGFRGTS